jgi:hypothetical protein
MERLHAHLKEQIPSYNRWHENPHHSSVHMLMLGLFITGCATILGLSASPVLGASAELGSGTNNWRAGAASGTQILEVQFSYDAASRPAIRVTKMQRKHGYAPTPEPQGSFAVRTIDRTGAVIAEVPFEIPNEFEDPPAELGDTRPRRTVLLQKADFAVTVAWSPTMEKIEIITDEGVTIGSYPLTGVPTIQNETHYQTLGSSRAKRTAFLDLLLPQAYAQTGQVLDITLIGDKYSSADMTLYHADVESVISAMLSYEPYASRAAQINFHYVDSTANLGCAYDATTARLLVCNNSAVTQAVNSAGAPYDKIGVLVKSATYGGSGGGMVAVTYNGSSKNEVFVHEMGHTFGGLHDEYLLYTSNGSISNTVQANCYAGTPPAAAWQGIVALSDYALGCRYPNWYRSSPTSIMKELSARYFNQVSQNILNQRIDYFAGSASLDLTAPVAAITNPVNNATVSGTAIVSATVSDAVGVTRAELWVDSILYETDSTAPYSFAWATLQSSNAAHMLVVKGYDAAGNAGSSSPVTVMVNNVADSIAPTVSISSPAANATVSGQTTVAIDASDNSGAVARVELFIDGTLLGSDVAAPFTFAWSTTGSSNGSHVIKAKAIDAAGNSTESATITVNVSNAGDTTPPDILITKPLNGTSVPTKGTMKVSASASDSGGIARIVISLDGTAIKTCTLITVCDTSVSTKSVSAGSHTISARAEDTAGNASTSSVVVTKL